MTSYDNITTGDLMKEGRRYVLEVGEYEQGS